MKNRSPTGDPTGMGAEPPYRSIKVGENHGKTMRHSPGDHDERNNPEGRGVLGDLGRGKQTMDSPVPTAGREMPNNAITSKAAEVASELSRHGDGEGFPGGGVMER